jgi:hypothetical protein
MREKEIKKLSPKEQLIQNHKKLVEMIKMVSIDVVKTEKRIDDLREHNEELLTSGECENEEDTLYQVNQELLYGVINLRKYKYENLGEMINKEVK